MKKNIKLRSLFEYDDKLSNYSVKFSEYIEKKLSNLNGWKPFTDDRSGAMYWEKKGSKYMILATPFWDGEEKLPINVQDDESGDDIYDIQYPLKPTYDMNKDLVTYKKLLIKVMSDIEKKLK